MHKSTRKALIRRKHNLTLTRSQPVRFRALAGVQPRRRRAGRCGRTPAYWLAIRRALDAADLEELLRAAHAGGALCRDCCPCSVCSWNREAGR